MRQARLIATLFVTVPCLRVDPNRIRLVQGFGATRRQVLTQVVMPGSVPTFVAALTVTAGPSLVGVVVGEFQSASLGLGYLIQWGSQTFKMNVVMCAIVVLAGVSLLTYAAIGRFERRVLARR